MNAKIWYDIKEIKNIKWISLITSMVAVITYGFFLTHASIGLDDTGIERYFIEGWAPYVGRWVLFLFNYVFDFAHFTPWFMDAIGVLLLCIASLLFCLLWYRISEKQVKTLSLVAFCLIFITHPLLGEVYIYYLHNGISFAFVLLALTGLSWWEYLSHKKSTQLIWMMVFVSLAIGCYESFALVYIVLICAIYICAVSKGCLAKRTVGCWIKDVALSIAVLVGSMVIRTIMYKIINAALGLEENARDMSAIKLWFVNNPLVILKDIAYQFLLRYILNAEYIFGIKVFILTVCAFVLTIIVIAIKKKQYKLLLWGTVMLSAPWLLAVLEMTISSYRASQALMLLIAFAWFYVFEALQQVNWKKGYRFIQISLVSILLIVSFRQGFELHQYFYRDYVKSEYDREYCRMLANELITEYDTSKPVIFVGQREMPKAFREYAYLETDSQEYYDLASKFNLQYTKAFQKYVHPDYGYGLYEVATSDVIAWMTWADLGDGEYEIYPYMEMLGYEFVQPTKDIRAEIVASASGDAEYPVWPAKGSIVETEEYICVYLGPVTVNL